ncbi:MAG: hypothetical protein Q3983_05145 [Capnocytophaga sp.]|nr:hypothetical protein [Capnocytophaga sp.]
MTYDEFYNDIEQLPKKVTNRDLETYLLALYDLALQHQEEVCTPTLCLELLEQAFTATPAPYNETWTAIRTMPEADNMSAFDYTKAVIVFQIAELHRIRGKELNNEMRGFGLTSETGYDWYNFDPFTLLECGARGLSDYIGEEEMIPNDWYFLGQLLDLGRYYE